MAETKTNFKAYFEDVVMVDRFAADPADAIDVIIPVLHTNELWKSNLLSIYREIPVNRLLLGDGGCIDDTIDVARRFPRVEVLDHRSLASLGFSIRSLIEQVETDWFAYLHSDVFLPPGWFEAMRAECGTFDWFECLQYTTVFLRWLAPTTEVDRAYSGGQFGRKAAFKEVLPKIQDDYLYRNEDIILARLVEEAGFHYGKVCSTYVDHQQMPKTSPWHRRIKGMTFDVEMSREEEVRAAMTFVKGIIKYLRPAGATDLFQAVRTNVYRLEQMEALQPGEFADWVADASPEWSDVLYPVESTGEEEILLPPPVVEEQPVLLAPPPVEEEEPPPPPEIEPVVLRRPSFRARLRWAPSAVFRKTARFLDGIATWLAPPRSSC